MKSRYARMAEEALQARRWTVGVWLLTRSVTVTVYAPNAAAAEANALRMYNNTVIRAITYSEQR